MKDSLWLCLVLVFAALWMMTWAALHSHSERVRNHFYDIKVVRQPVGHTVVWFVTPDGRTVGREIRYFCPPEVGE